MCAIVGSFDRNKLIELIELNSYRGSHSYSFSTLNTYNQLTVRKQGLGSINYDDIIVHSGYYGIVHIQAPTTDAKSLDTVHPAISKNESTFRKDKYTLEKKPYSCLWHNGIIKDDCIKKLQQKQSTDEVWDTKLLLNEVDNSFSNLNSIDGTFSCCYYKDGRLYLFRNDISPMFIDEQLNISSTKFEGSVATEPNKVWLVDTYYKVLHNVFEFETVENPYFFLED